MIVHPPGEARERHQTCPWTSFLRYPSTRVSMAPCCARSNPLDSAVAGTPSDGSSHSNAAVSGDGGGAQSSLVDFCPYSGSTSMTWLGPDGSDEFTSIKRS